MQKIATQVFMVASIAFGLIGITVILVEPEEDTILFKMLIISVFVILPSFALSVAGKYLKK